MAGQRIAGVCYIKLDGEQLEVKGSVEVPLSSTMRETQMGANGPAGFSEMAQRPFIKLTAFFPPNFPIEKVTESTDLTVTAELANGKTYVLSQAWMEGEGTVSNDDGTTELEFSGMRGIWQ